MLILYSQSLDNWVKSWPQTDKQILWHHIQGYADFFFLLYLLPPYLLCPQGDNERVNWLVSLALSFFFLLFAFFFLLLLLCVKSCLECKQVILIKLCKFITLIQAWIAQLIALQLGTTEVMGSNPGKIVDYSLKIWIWMLN